MPLTIGMSQAKELLEGGIAQAEELIKEPSKVDEMLIRLEDKLREVPAIGETLADLPLMISMIKAYITGAYTEVSPKVIACLAGAFVYLIRRQDLIPDEMPVIGVADDIAVITLAMKICEPELNEFREWRNSQS